jgi:TolB-like protein
MKFLGLILACWLITGCASIPGIEYLTGQPDSQQAEDDSESNIVDITTDAQPVLSSDEIARKDSGPDAFGSIEKPNIIGATPGAFKSLPLTRHIGHYVRNMAQDLVANMEYVTERTPVAVTHFSLIDSDLRETNLLGQQMAESFVHEFHKFRMPVVEFKATQFIRVTESGDYILSRDFLDLNNSTPIQYVLTGTMTKHQGGFIVNARMLGMESKVVVASAQSFVPFYVVDALIPSESSRQNEVIDGVRIIRGE